MGRSIQIAEGMSKINNCVVRKFGSKVNLGRFSLMCNNCVRSGLAACCVRSGLAACCILLYTRESEPINLYLAWNSCHDDSIQDNVSVV